MSNKNTTMNQAADTLRGWASDENLKALVLSQPALAHTAQNIARRYIAGERAEQALVLLQENTLRGHRGSVELLGESIRDRNTARRETRAFIELAGSLNQNSQRPTLSLDLSHLGLLIDTDFGYRNALLVAQAARDAGTYLMISAEGSARTELILSTWEKLATEFPETGLTLQARLHRTKDDLLRVSAKPGPIRIVKGAFGEPDSVAHPRNAPRMYETYGWAVEQLVRSGHRINIATHDAQLLAQLRDELGEELRGEHVEFEMLQGLGTELLDLLQREGFSTREYVVFGEQWWLYVLNRLAEHPERVIGALADLR